MVAVDLTCGGAIATPSFQSLFLRMKFGDTQLATGTGFLVQTTIGVALVTARHNLTGRHHETNACLHTQGGVPDVVEIFQNTFTPAANIVKTEPLLDASGAPFWIEHPTRGPECDVALLPLHDLSGVVVAPYERQEKYADIAIKVAEPVSVVGFPMGQSAGAMYAIWCTGYVASEPSQDYAGQPKFLVDCRTRRGQSGSPVIAYRSGPYTSGSAALNVGGGPVMRPLGVYTGRIDPDADIGVVWKWSIVEDLMMEFDLRVTRHIQSSITQFGRYSAEVATELKKYNLTVA